MIVELHLKNVKRYQLIKLSDQKIKIIVVKEETAEQLKIEKDINNKLKTILNKKNMNNVELKIEFVNKIKNDPVTKKFKLIKTSQTLDSL